MFCINRYLGKPTYLQIFDDILQMISSGELRAGEKLPSVRFLAMNLSVNPNTIQKAYAALIKNGIINSTAGNGSFVAPDVSERIIAYYQTLLDALAVTLRDLAKVPIGKDDVLLVVEEVWGEPQMPETSAQMRAPVRE